MAEHTPIRMCDSDERYLTWLYTVGKCRQNWHTIFLKGSPKRFKYHIWSRTLRHAGPRRTETSGFFISIYFTSGSHNIKVGYDWMVVGTCQPTCGRILSIMKTLTSRIVYVMIRLCIWFILKGRRSSVHIWCSIWPNAWNDSTINVLYQSFLSHVFFRTTEWISVNLGPGVVLNLLDRCHFNLY
jgi:hypothetical protein